MRSVSRVFQKVKAMAKDYAKAFYNSARWKKCRLAFLTEHPVCERCERMGIVTPSNHVHHIIYITPDNINDPETVLNWDNLEALCHDCHTREHKVLSQVGDGLLFDANGDLVRRGGHGSKN